MGEVARRLVALLRIIERGPARFGVLGDDALLDAWFGRRSPAFPAEAHTPVCRAEAHTPVCRAEAADPT